MSETPPFGSGNDFEAIASTVQATERGRVFLTEFARRRRESERATLRDAVTQLELAISREMARPATPRSVPAEAPTPEALQPRIDQAVAEVDGIIATTTTVANALTIAKEARALAKRAGANDTTLAADLAKLASAIEACGFQAQVGNRTREIFDVLMEVREHLGDASVGDTPEGGAREPQTVISVAKLVVPLKLAAANDSTPRGVVTRLSALSEEERIALFT